jgi:hypothetical protein
LNSSQESKKLKRENIDKAAYKAAEKGYFRLAQWLYKTLSYKTSNLCSAAAEGDRLEILQWATNGCPLHEGSYQLAKTNGLYF